MRGTAAATASLSLGALLATELPAAAQQSDPSLRVGPFPAHAARMRGAARRARRRMLALCAPDEPAFHVPELAQPSKPPARALLRRSANGSQPAASSSRRRGVNGSARWSLSRANGVSTVNDPFVDAGCVCPALARQWRNAAEAAVAWASTCALRVFHRLMWDCL